MLGIGTINKIVKRNQHLSGAPFVNAACNEMGIEVNLIGQENLPTTGPVTIVANHPGGADVLATIIAIGKVRQDMSILANKLICIEPVQDIVIPINITPGKKVDPSLVHEAYRQGKVIVFYAAGKNSRYNKDGLLRDRRWRTTFLEYAKQYNSPVVVMKIGGKNSPLFYKISKFRERHKSLKNVPLENMFQLREMILAKGTLDVFLSKPVSFLTDTEPPNLTKKQIIRKQADTLYDFLYSMDENNLELKQSNDSET
jgi:1-acyl-sn-glycerol-3-phosphate acyltransferase